MRLKDKVAIVTGSTKGIGRTIASVFASEGANVIVTGRNSEAGDGVAAKIRRRGGNASFIAADLSVEDQVQSLIDRTMETYRRITTVVNNAAPIDLLHSPGIVGGTVATMATETWNELIRQSLTSMFMVCKYSIPHLINEGGGSIVNISSISSTRGTRGGEAYPVAKAGMNALSREIAVDFAPYSIRSNTLLLGRIVVDPTLASEPERQAVWDTFTLSPEAGQPKDVAQAALFLASDESLFITGTEIPLDGGTGIHLPFPRRASPI